MFSIIEIVICVGFVVSILLYHNERVLGLIDGVVQQVAQTIVDASKLDIQSIEITKCDDSSFLVSMSAFIFNTGPLPATIESMTLSMYATKSGPAFAQVKLPTLNVQPSGVVCKVEGQRIEVLDFEAFHIFNRNLTLHAELPVTVKGSSSLTVFEILRTKIEYCKTSILTGLNGVHITPLETRKHSRSLLRGKISEIEVDVNIVSESEVSIEMGDTVVQIVSQVMKQYEPIVIANMRAYVFLRPGDNKITFHGTIDLGEMTKHCLRGLSFLKKDMSKKERVQATVLGVTSEQCSWLARTVQEMKSPIEMDSTMRDIMRSVQSRRAPETPPASDSSP